MTSIDVGVMTFLVTLQVVSLVCLWLQHKQHQKDLAKCEADTEEKVRRRWTRGYNLLDRLKTARKLVEGNKCQKYREIVDARDLGPLEFGQSIGVPSGVALINANMTFYGTNLPAVIMDVDSSLEHCHVAVPNHVSDKGAVIQARGG